MIRLAAWTVLGLGLVMPVAACGSATVVGEPCAEDGDCPGSVCNRGVCCPTDCAGACDEGGRCAAGDVMGLWRFAGGASGVAFTSNGDVAAVGDVGGETVVVDTPASTTAADGDSDAVLARVTRAGSIAWLRQLGDEERQIGAAVAVGPGDAIALGGSYYGGISFGDIELSPVSGLDPVYVVDGYFAVYQPDGQPAWARGLHGAGIQHTRAVAFSSDGGLAVAGVVEGTVDVGTGPIGSGIDGPDEHGLLAMFDASGEARWARSLSGLAVSDVATTLEGDVVVAGNSDVPLDLGGGMLTPNGFDGVVARYDSSGGFLWAVLLGADGDDSARSVAATPDGDLVVGGTRELSRLDPLGRVRWTHSYATNNGDDWQRVEAVTVDRHGNVVAAGSFSGAITLDGELYQATGDLIGFVQKLTPSGQPLWHHVLASETRSLALDVAVGADDVVAVAGYFTDTLTVADRELTLPSYNGFLLLLSP